MSTRTPFSRGPDPAPPDGVDEPTPEPFDPYRFQSVPVSPELRQKLLSAKLPRLESKYFEDTLPPAGRSNDAADARRMPSSAAHLLTKIVLFAALVVGAAAAAMSAWLRSR